MSGSKIHGDITYIDVDSSFRDRHKYPNPADFKVPYGNSRVRNNINNSLNVLSDSYPYYQWQWGIGVGSPTNSSSINGFHSIKNNNEVGLEFFTYVSTGILVNGGVTANTGDTTVNVDNVTDATTVLAIGDVITRFDGTLYGTLKTVNSGSIVFDALEFGLQTDAIDNDELYVRKMITTFYGQTFTDFFAGLQIRFLTKSTTINHSAGYAAGSETVTIVAPATPLEVGQLLFKSDGTIIGSIVEIISSTSIRFDETSALVVNGEELYINTSVDRIRSYDDNDFLLFLMNEQSTITSTVNYLISTFMSENQAFIPGGNPRDGHYVGDYYESLVYGRTDTTKPTVHEFRKIISYNGKTRIATLESNKTLSVNISNKSGEDSATYVHRLRKKIPILPSGSGIDIDTDNIPLIQGTATEGCVFSIEISNGGTGHAVGDVIVLGGGTNCKVSVLTVDSNGVVSGLTVERGGSGYVIDKIVTQSSTSGSGTGLRVRIVDVGTGVNIHGANGVSTSRGTYQDELLYYPAFAGGGGVANLDPSASQDFIPQNNTLDVDSPGRSFSDSSHCTFIILAHHVYSSDNINELVIKTLNETERGYFVANKEFNILEFKEDGVQVITNNTYKDPKKLNNYYEVSLLNLILPNTSLITGPGGFIANHGYVMVEFYSDSYDKANIYNTNNPHLENVMFKCMVLDISNPGTIPFVKFKGAYPIVTQFKLNESVNFRVLMPNGEIFRTSSSDRVPPSIPDKDLQVSATFMLKKLK